MYACNICNSNLTITKLLTEETPDEEQLWGNSQSKTCKWIGKNHGEEAHTNGP
jgi:hypothetical protein